MEDELFDFGEETTSQIDTPSEPIEVQETQVEEPIQETEVNNTTVNEPTGDGKINIEGLGSFTIDELKEMQKGYMRQSDYTRKTQEIARQREEIERLREQSIQPNIQPNTHMQGNPFEQRIIELEQRIADKELDDTITNLKQKYPDFDEVKVLNLAYEKGITDLEMVYKSTREITPVDVESIKAQLRTEIMNEINQNATATGTIISTGNPAVQNKVVQLSPQEKAMALEWGMTEEEYLEYK